MIIGLLVVMTLVAYLGGVYVENRRVANGIRLISDLLLVGIVGLIIANNSYHFGMTPVVQTTTTKLRATVSHKQISVLSYQPLGTAGKEQIYLYRTPATKKIQRTTAELTQNRVKRGLGAAKLISKEKTWHYQNPLARFMFQIAGNEGTRIQTQNIFEVPEDWLVLSTKEAKKLAVSLKKPQVQKKLTTALQAKMQQALKRNPQMSKQQQKAQLKVDQRQELERLVK